MFLFKAYSPSKRTFNRVKSNNSTPSPTREIRETTPEATMASTPSSVVRTASVALISLAANISTAFRGLSASVSRPATPSTRRPPALINQALSPSGLSFSSQLSSPEDVDRPMSPIGITGPVSEVRNYRPLQLRFNRNDLDRSSENVDAYSETPSPTNPSHNQTTTPDDAAFDSDSFVLPPRLSYSAFDDDNDDDVNDDDEGTSAIQMPKKRGKKVHSTFLLPPQGELLHPYLGWVIDKDAMYEYIPNYTKQEGFAANASKDRNIIRFRCIHAGKYNDHRRLPPDVTNKNQRKQTAEAGTLKIFIFVTNILGQRIRQRRGASSKQGCPFYVAFTELDSVSKYRCSGIHALHTCEQDPNTWDRYSRYRNKDPAVRNDAAELMKNGIRSGQAASFLNSRYGTRIQPKDIHRIVQTNKESMRSLSDAGLSISQCQRLLDTITQNNDRYRVKFKEGTRIMDCIFYWDPSDVKLARRFCQVLQIDSTFKDNVWKYPLLEITATTNEMNTFLIAQAMIQSESVETLVWIFEQVR